MDLQLGEIQDEATLLRQLGPVLERFGLVLRKKLQRRPRLVEPEQCELRFDRFICPRGWVGPTAGRADDIAAFQALSRTPRGSPERVLYESVNRFGFSSVVEKIAAAANSRDDWSTIILGWIRDGVVASDRAHLVGALRDKAPEKLYQGNRNGGRDPRRQEVHALAAEFRRAHGPEVRLPARKIADTVGVSRQTVERWLKTEPRPMGRPRKERQAS